MSKNVRYLGWTVLLSKPSRSIFEDAIAAGCRASQFADAAAAAAFRPIGGRADFAVLFGDEFDPPARTNRLLWQVAPLVGLHLPQQAAALDVATEGDASAQFRGVNRLRDSGIEPVETIVFMSSPIVHSCYVDLFAFCGGGGERPHLGVVSGDPGYGWGPRTAFVFGCRNGGRRA